MDDVNDIVGAIETHNMRARQLIINHVASVGVAANLLSELNKVTNNEKVSILVRSMSDEVMEIAEVFDSFIEDIGRIVKWNAETLENVESKIAEINAKVSRLD